MARASAKPDLTARLVLLVTAVLPLVGCAGATPTPTAPTPTAEPTFVRSLDAGGGVVRRMLIYDAAGLLVDVQPEAHAVASPDISWHAVDGAPYQLALVWIGGVCGVDPTLTVRKEGSRVSLAVFEGHNRPLASNEVCPAIGTNYGLVLTFRERVSTFDVSVSLSEEPQ